MMKEYNEAIDNNKLNTYEHPQPKNWDNFHRLFITSFKDEIIINHLSEDRTLKQSFKYQRKRGEIVKDKNGKKIVQRGDTTRGKLHDESIFGMVKMPETEFREGKYRLKITDGELTFKQNEKRKDELFVVKRIKITDIKSIDDFEKIVIDPNLGYYLKNEVERRMKEQNIPFEKVVLQPIYAFGKEKDKIGKTLQPIRHLRCKTIWNSPPEIKKIEDAFKSKKTHKQTTYANNGKTPVCAIYEWEEKGKLNRELEPITILQMSNAHHFNNSHQITEPQRVVTKGSGKNKVEITKKLAVLLFGGQHVIFYQESLDELSELYMTDKKVFSKRLYTANVFDDGRIIFIHHLCSLPDKEITKIMEARGYKKGASFVDFENPFLKLRLSQGALNMAIEGKHFEIKSDGEVRWLLQEL